MQKTNLIGFRGRYIDHLSIEAVYDHFWTHVRQGLPLGGVGVTVERGGYRWAGRYHWAGNDA